MKSRTVTSIGIAVALALGGSTVAQAADSPPPVRAVRTATASESGSGVLTIKARTSGSGTNFSGTYRITDGTTTRPGTDVHIDLQRRTPTGWDTVTTDTADRNGNVVFGTVHSHYVQTWRLVPDLPSSGPGYGVSRSVHIARSGKAETHLTFPTVGFRTGKHVAFNGYFTYRSWWITSGPDAGKQGFVAPLRTRLYLQYWTGSTWRTKTTVLTEDRRDDGVNAYVDVHTNYSSPSRWRWYYPGSSSRQSAVSKTITR